MTILCKIGEGKGMASAGLFLRRSQIFLYPPL